MKKLLKLEEPLNSNERYLYGISERLEMLIEAITNSKVEYLGEGENDRQEFEPEITEAKEEHITEVEEMLEVEELPASEKEEISFAYEELTKAEMQEILKKREIPFNKNMNKTELLELLKQEPISIDNI